MFIKTTKLRKVLVTACACALVITGGLTLHTATAQAKGTYTVKTSTKPCNKSYTKLATYNKKTKQYYMLRSYLEKLEKKGGGTLTIKKGTYNVPCTLYVPSNVTIKFKSGAVLKKTAKTGNKKLAAGKSVLELVPPSKSTKKNKVKKYAGSKNVTISGSGKAAIDLAGVNNSTGIVIGHAQNINISGITFKNMKGDSYINIAAAKKVSVSSCTFSKAKTATAPISNYAISLEVPDATTKVFNYSWSKYDNTINNDILISNNSFAGLVSAIGSNKYTASVYHNKVKITGNKFSSISSNVIRVLNWKDADISSNTFVDVAGGAGSVCGVLMSGAVNPLVTGNNFDRVPVPVKLLPTNNIGAGSAYATTYNTLTGPFITGLENNNVANAQVYYAINQTTTDASSAQRIAYYMDYTSKDYVITAGCNPYHDYYTDDKWYNQYTKDYYVFRSYLEQLERVGGGTLTVQTGTYSITNTLFVPSNVTINFQHGVLLQKGTYTGFDSTVLAPSLSLFQFVAPSLSTTTATVGGYNGSHNISFIGQGTVTFNLLFYTNCNGIVMGHNKDILIQGINFINYKGHHFIELDASQNVTIQGCSFAGSSFTGSSDDYKEAINIDIPDKNTGGFNVNWTTYDRTANNNIVIQNNTFFNVLRAIGTHKYSVAFDNVTQIYHTNVQILNNTITNTQSQAIRAINWKDCIIKGNTIKNVSNGTKAAVLMSGVVNPTVTLNTFDTALRPITLNSTDSSDSKTADKAYPPTHTILDSIEETGVNISAMLNNSLIDMTGTNQIVFYIGGSDKKTSTDVKKYDFTADHIRYTHPTATPAPTNTPKPTTEPSVSPDVTGTPNPSASPKPTKEPSGTEAPKSTDVPDTSSTPVPSETPVPGDTTETIVVQS